jgi:tRNA modification GTPase
MATASSRGLSSALAGGAETIVACATPPGRGALAVIRVSGPSAEDVSRLVCPDVSFKDGWRATLTAVLNSEREVLDRAIAVSYPAPRSYTGENMLEVTIHGSAYLIAEVIESFVTAGSRRAKPGEFTRRAVANGKLDLIQAEAIRDLIDSDTAWQVRNAQRQLSGVLSADFAEMRASFIELVATLEASLDFEAQGVEVPVVEIETSLASSRDRVGGLLATARAGERIRDGARVVILGPPNAGKSTLFNYLCGSERAIVSPHPGTTRDVIEAEFDVAGVRTVIQDTAGVRSEGDAVEAEGRRRALRTAENADVVILLWAVDDQGGGPPPVPSTAAPVIRIRSKADLGDDDGGSDGWLRMSCQTGEGLVELRSRLVRVVEGEIPDLGGAVAIAARHREALLAAAAELEGCDPGFPEVAAERARWAIRAVEELIGDVGSEDVLDAIYSRFCIGK